MRGERYDATRVGVGRNRAAAQLTDRTRIGLGALGLSCVRSSKCSTRYYALGEFGVACICGRSVDPAAWQQK